MRHQAAPAPRTSPSTLDRGSGLIDPMLFSGVWAACVALTLTLASGLALGLADWPSVPTLALSFAGTLAIYNVDRLRDLERDRVTAPLRSAWVEQNRRRLLGVTGVAFAICLALGLRAGPGVWILCGGCLAIGLLHRRLKRGRVAKVVYVTGVWVVVVVGLPTVAVGGSAMPERLPWVGGVMMLAIAPNLIASNLPADDLALSWLWAARVLAACGVVLALLGPASVTALGLVPLAQGAALLSTRPSERYRLAVLDGSLLLGGLGAALADWIG